jgi:peroxiredoxin
VGVIVMIEDARKKKKNKMKRRFIFRTIVLAILLVAVVFALVTNLNKDNELYKVGDEAPDFELTQINESNEVETIRLSDLEGKGVMLNFWATYCEPCEAEIPFMESLYPEYADDIEIVAVSLDASELVIHQFIQKYDLTFPVVHDTKSEVMDLYKVGPIPSTFFINPDGQIVDKVAGALTLEKLEGHFNEILPK